MKLSKRIFTLLTAALLLSTLLSMLSMTPAAASYTEGQVVADLDTMFEADVNQDADALMKPVVKLNQYNLIKPMDIYGGIYYQTNYSGTAIQKAGVNGLPYAGVNFSRDNEPGGVAITAPVDGTYTLRGTFSRHDERVGGSFTASWVYATVNDKGDPLFSKKFWRTDGEVSVEATVSLKKGDVIYVFSDPNGTNNAFWEDFTYFHSLTLTLDTLGYNAQDNVKKWKAGDEIGNINSFFDRNVLEADKALMTPVVKKLQSGVIVPMDIFGGDYYKYDQCVIAKEGKNGEPYVVTSWSKAYHAIGIAFEAPVSGTYQLSGLFNRKDARTDTDNAEFTKTWIYVNVNNEGEALFSEKFWRTEGGVACDLTVELVAGDILYVFTDPNGGENAWWEDPTHIQELSLTILEVSDVQPPVTSAPDTEPPVESSTEEHETDPVATTPEETEPVATTPEETEPTVTTPEGTESLPVTDDVTTEKVDSEEKEDGNLGLILGIAAAVVATIVVVIVVIRKKK